MSELDQLTQAILRFRDARDWAQFHNPKDLAAALAIEAGELQEAYLWKQSKEADAAKVREELADVVMYALLLAHESKIDLAEAIKAKLLVNEAKYPVDKSKGRSTKHDQL